MLFNIKRFGVLLTAVTGALAGVGEECEFFNTLIGKASTYDCCSLGYPKIKCSSDHITYINLSDNDIEGNLPTSLNKLEGLVVLNLQRNKITGSIPDISNLKNLVELRLNNNQLTGNIPSSIGNLVNLKVLDLSNNDIDGTIPAGIYDLSRLTDIKLGYNKITGRIGDDIEKLKNLRIINLNDNNMSGQLTRYIGDLYNLITLDLTNNKFEKEIPNSIGNLSNLQVLRLGYNEFSGELPTSSLEKIKTLTEIVLEGNKELYGKIPVISSITEGSKCLYENTKVCFIRGDFNNKCKFPINECIQCAENARVSNEICRCKDGYVGIGYISCSSQAEVGDQNLKNKDGAKNSASSLKTSLSSLVINALVIVASLILYSL